VPAKCPKCGGEAKLEAIREAGGRCPHCKARIKVRFTGVPRPVKRAPGRTPGVKALKRSLESIGPYEVMSEVSRGGMGIVYKARDTNLKKTVAIKVLIRGGQASEEERKRFRREAEAAAKLQHSNIVPIHAVGVCDGLPYFVMDFIDGEQLDLLIDRGSVSPRQSLDYTEQLADALAYAHASGVIHRDIKPANVIIDRYGRPQLMDFGLAKEIDAADRTQLTQVGTTMGTPTYMPPEQAEGDLEGIDAQSDVYSLGAVLYEMLTGQPPFEGPSTMAILMKVLEEEPPRPRGRNPRIHPDIETICLKAMAKEKRERYRSAEELREDIRRFKAGEAITAVQPGNTRMMWRWAKRHRELVAAVFLAFAALGGWLGYDAWTRRQASLRSRKIKEDEILTAMAAAGQVLSAADPDEAALTRAARNYQRVLDLGPAEKKTADLARDGLVRIAEIRRRRQIDSLLEMGRLFMDKKNYEAAAHVYRLVLGKWDKGNAEAKRRLREAVGTGTLLVLSQPEGAAVYVATGKNFPEPELDCDPAQLGRLLGSTPFKKPVDLPMGLHRVTLVRKGYGRQSIPVLIGRNQDVVPGKVRMIKGEAVGGEAAAANLVLVPGGKVKIDENTVKKVAAFYIDRYEHPNRLGVKPTCGRTFKVPDRNWNWHEAHSLTRDSRRKLPTRAQWMLAAGGPKALRFPYGQEYDSTAAAAGLAEKEGPLPAGSRPRDRSPYGLYDMAGNVAEWVRREEDEEPPPYYEPEESYDACGGHWFSEARDHSLVSYYKPYFPGGDSMDEVGFRRVLEKGKKPEPRKSPEETPKKPGKPEFEDVVVDKCPPGWVVVEPREGTPAHKLVPYAFCIQKYEWPNREEQVPETGVTWEQACLKARAKGWRLPTRNEWRVACGGNQLWDYPYGREYREDKDNETNNIFVGQGGDVKKPMPSGKMTGTKSPFGVFDLSGNVLEWVWQDAKTGSHGVIGGCWIGTREEARASYWAAELPGAGSKVTGFRCVVKLRRPAKKPE